MTGSRPGHRRRVLLVGAAMVALLGAQMTLATVAPTAPAPGPSWAATESLLFARRGHTATVVDGPACRGDSPPAYCGKVLVIGGNDSEETLASAEIYDHQARRWAPVAPPRTAREGHSATLLDPPFCKNGTAPAGYPCGQVLIAGGFSDGNGVEPVDSAELYAPATDSWSPAGTARSGTATLLGDGTVLIVGGASAEIYNPVSTTPARHLLSVDDPPPASEGNSRPGIATFTVRLSSPSPLTVTVEYETAEYTATGAQTAPSAQPSPSPSATAPATACAGAPPSVAPAASEPGSCDYVPTSGTLTFSAGESEKTVAVPLPADRHPEANESFGLRLSNAKDAVVAKGEGIATIVDDDNPFVSVSPARVVEADAGSSTITSFSVSLSHPARANGATVSYTTEAAGATGGDDYVSETGTVVFAAGDQTKTVEIEVLGDDVVEGDEDFWVKLGSATNASIAAGQAQATIVDDDPVGLRVDDLAVGEGDGTASFRVWLSHAVDQRVTVKASTEAETASAASESAPGDFVAKTGVEVVFEPGDTEESIEVVVADDSSAEIDETFFLGLSEPSGAGAVLANVRGRATIENDDLVELAVNNPTVSEGSQGTTLLSFTLSLPAPNEDRTNHVDLDADVVVHYATQDASATVADADYLPVRGKASFGSGVSQATVTVELRGDTIPEGDEKLVLGVETDAAFVTVDDGGGRATIENDDPPVSGGSRAITPPAHARFGHSATLLGDGTVLVAGGNCSPGEPAEIYDPEHESWSTVNLVLPRRFHTATRLAPAAGGKVLLAGGQGCSGTGELDSSAQLYDPATRSTVATQSMGTPRSSHSATLLEDGTVVVAGGQAHPDQGLSRLGRRAGTGGDLGCDTGCQAERYHPATGTWTTAGKMLLTRGQHVAAAVSPDKVVVAGGVGEQQATLASAEVFSVSAPPVPSVTGLSRASGPTAGGTRVIISGGRFDDVEQVRFGSAPAIHEVESPGRISVLTPPAQSAGTVDLTVETAAGTSAPIRPARFTYVDPTGGWTPSADLEQRHSHTATRLDSPECRAGVPHDWCGDVLVLGGTNGSGRAADDRLYDTAERAWTPAKEIGPRSGGAAGHTATLLDPPQCQAATPPAGNDDYPCGDVLVVGGTTSSGSGRYDPDAGWVATADHCALPGACPQRGHSATLLDDGRVLVVGGTTTDGAVVGSARMYDPVADRWSEVVALVTPRTGHSATVLVDGSVLVVGGSGTSGEKLASAERYVPGSGPASSGRWESAAGLTTARSGHTATRLRDGSVVVVGGVGGGGKLSSAERYVLHAGAATWRSTGSLSAARARHTATLLVGPGCAGNCGKVLVVGGTGSDATLLAGAELYDPTGSGEWMATSGLDGCSPSRSCTPRTLHTATALPGGDVLVVGGREPPRPPQGAPPSGTPAVGVLLPAPPPSATAEVYHSTTGQPTVRFLSPSFGSTFGGTPVTVVGTGFFSTPLVRFGGVMATKVTRISEAEVVAVTPPQAQGSAPVTVETSSGTSPAGPGFEYRGGVFAEVDALTTCGPHPSCAARFLHTATLLDPPACHAPSPPLAYPCGKVLVSGGTIANGGIAGSPQEVRASAQLYDPATGKWAPTGSMAMPRYNHSATLLADGKVLVAGGKMHPPTSTAGEAHASAELYDPVTGVWRPTGPMNDARYAHTATSLEPSACRGPNPPADYPCGAVLVTGGAMEEMRWVAMASTEIYDPRFGVWSTVRPLDSCTPASTACSARVAHTAALLGDGRVVVAGGAAAAPPLDPGVIGGVLPPGAGDSVSDDVGDVADVGTSLDPTKCPPGRRLPPVFGACPVRFLASSQVFDPRTELWAASGSMGGVEGGAPRAFHTATALPDGEVLVTGGQTMLRVPVSSAERYQPDTTDPETGRRGQWVPTGSLGRARAGHTATLLAGGRVLVTGSGTSFIEAGTIPDESAEIYDPASGRWSYPNFMTEERGVHTATLLTGRPCREPSPPAWCNTVLLAGGAGRLDPSLNTEALEQSADECRERTSPSQPDGCVSAAMASAEVFTPAPTVASVTPGAVSARGGTRVTVSGSGFSRDSTVRVASTVVAAPGVDSWAKLSFTAPAHAAGPAVVEVINAGGTSAKLDPDPSARLLYARAAGAIDNLTAVALSPTAVRLSFAGAPDGTSVDYALDYEVTQVAGDSSPVMLCGGVCRARREDSPTDRRPRSLEITDLTPSTTYRWTLRPYNAVGEAGSQTATVSLTTPGDALPGAVTDLTARPDGPGAVALGFSAPASFGPLGPPPTRYEVRQSLSPIDSEESFVSARPLCGGECALGPTSVGERLSLRVTGLAAGTTYHYALRALTDRGAGPRSNAAAVTTEGVAGACRPLSTSEPGAVTYRGGRYVLLGLPEGTQVPSVSPLYGWFDLGARGAYSLDRAGARVMGGRGYWSWSPCDRAVVPAGAGVSSLSVPLGAYRASMVGNPSGEAPVSVSGHDWAARWDPEANAGAGGYRLSAYRQPQPLAVGEGMWVFSYQQTVIRLQE